MVRNSSRIRSRDAVRPWSSGRVNSSSERTLGLIVTSTSVPGGNGTPATRTRPCSSTVADVSYVVMALIRGGQERLFHCLSDAGSKQKTSDSGFPKLGSKGKLKAQVAERSG